MPHHLRLGEGRHTHPRVMSSCPLLQRSPDVVADIKSNPSLFIIVHKVSRHHCSSSSSGLDPGSLPPEFQFGAKQPFALHIRPLEATA